MIHDLLVIAVLWLVVTLLLAVVWAVAMKDHWKDPGE